MKKKRRLIFLFVFLMLICIGCVQKERKVEEEESSAKICLGMSLYSLRDEYTKRFANVVIQYAKAENIELKIYDGNYDAARQITQVEEMIKADLDGIILIPQNANECIPCVDKAVAAGKPIISVNTRVNSDEITSYVGSDDVQAGEYLMEYVAQTLEGKGNIVILEGPMGQSAQIERMEGIKNILTQYPEIKVIGSKTANWSRLEADVVMQSWMETFDQIDAVVAENDDMALGAIDALGRNGQEVVVVGIDGAEKALRAIEEKKLLATVFQNAEKQGEKSIEIMLDYLEGKEIDKNYQIPLEIVDERNIADYL
ncbi:inositol transport system substrate-binding protein [Aequitasia blattaphilus]|uniref:Substrate-binding domain-containing protein n=1 Tax=Aequitasia blattaphilus TaxID=2949332 RepID=A0ABT1EBS8_9FIRM|nr:substrate-binding domain-containing protein [Aequitasia blattaphilus]MCP1103289.1 substrate-binding domain-containing protein [Aequitasia blattaphilus]MCR8615929.1 substrate-binding domain-containing protein [Aequitasia blattaphilus]